MSLKIESISQPLAMIDSAGCGGDIASKIRVLVLGRVGIMGSA